MLDLLNRIWNRIKNLDFAVFGQFDARLKEIKALLVEIRDILTNPAPEPEASAELVATADRADSIAQGAQALAGRLKDLSFSTD